MQLPAILLITLTSLTLPALAAEYSCPDLGQAGPVNSCPGEEELRYTYTGFCSDNSKVYGKETDACPRYEDYRAMKNTVLW